MGYVKYNTDQFVAQPTWHVVLVDPFEYPSLNNSFIGKYNVEVRYIHKEI